MIANSVLESIFLEQGVDPFSIFEYTFPENSQILPMVPLCSLPAGHSLETGSDESSISSPRFASGRIFVPSLFGSLFANSYTTPGIMELVEAMIMPSRRNQTSFPFMLPALERVAVNWIGRTYRELATVSSIAKPLLKLVVESCWLFYVFPESWYQSEPHPTGTLPEWPGGGECLCLRVHTLPSSGPVPQGARSRRPRSKHQGTQYVYMYRCNMQEKQYLIALMPA